MSVMIISFEASANIDTTLFGYFSMQYDPEFFSDIKENLTDISKDDTLSFKLDPEEVKLLHGSYENVRRIISLPEVNCTLIGITFTLLASMLHKKALILLNFSR